MTTLAPPTTDAPAGPAVTPAVVLPPDNFGYRLKCRLLGQPLPTADLEHERLGRPTALAVFASDNLSSSAYATEEILRVLVPAVGLAAFSLVVPITVAMLIVLAFLILSYRETIKAYPTAGGAYMVTRDNFGLLPAQVAGVALLTDYVLTVSVSVAAGTAALVSAFGGLSPYTVPISVGFIVLIAFGNLRGVKESGRIFAAPTYFFIVNMVALLGVGLSRMAFGQLPHANHARAGIMPLGHSASSGLLMGASLYVVMHAFASGGAAVTGVEAISNGVPAFRKPEWKNARSTLVVMGTLLGVMFLGLSVLGAHLKTVPFEGGTPTVISQIGDLIYGPSALGRVLFYGLQAGTMLILVLAANTSFADFPRLASFHAGDKFMPRQLTKRGHRLVFSNGIVFLSISAIALVIVTGAKVDRLIPLYAIGVFTSFTLSQAGMARHHLRQKEPGWRKGIVINGTGAVLSLLVDIVIAITKFTHGAWVIVVLVPVMVVFLVRLARQYEIEDDQLEHDVPAAVAAPILRRHVVLVFVDRLDLAAARAIQYARTLMPDELRAVHFVIDHHVGDELAAAWIEHGMSHIALDLVDCPDRRITRAAVETVAGDLADGTTEVSVLLPERKYRGVWHRLLHDQTADAIVRDVSRLPHANVTTVPFHFASTRTRTRSGSGSGSGSVDAPAMAAVSRRNGKVSATGERDAPAWRPPDGVVPIASLRLRQPAVVEGRIRTVRVLPLAGSATLECVVEDPTGSVSVVFFGRRKIAGVDVGTRIRATGTVTDHRGRRAILNPLYELVP
ncbi:MAG: nucleic acid binding OB-fold tRNA/helicase-type [Acidimicrobiales bacterium]|jgi:amino acid transporter|nr:nucleic acid binding OB-fold tRNA/helicase-type [Acidimicrobiales bacterium]